MMTVNVKFVGALRHIADKSDMIIECPVDFSVKELLQKIILYLPEIKTNIVNQQTGNVVKTNVLILVNDREISVLNGMDTLLNSGDEVVFIPVVHGG
ncbi:MAG: MoaD/ThiS family protein [Candidatus Bathyarchaeota archaeon]|nr:MoaD/ThiS family protein [Candidatus Termiticorpusculum sp.]